MNPIPINKYALSVAEAASVLGVSSCKIYQLIKSKDLPAHKTGHTWKIPADAIDNYINRP